MADKVQDGKPGGTDSGGGLERTETGRVEAGRAETERGETSKPVAGNLVTAEALAGTMMVRVSGNGVRYCSFGDTGVAAGELERIIGAVPVTVSRALGGRAFYFVPLAMASDRKGGVTMVAPVYSGELAEEAICHRNVDLPARTGEAAHEGVFVSARLMRDQFSLAFEFLINVAHGFCAGVGVPDAFRALAWTQAVADVRGETSQDAWEARAEALPRGEGAEGKAGARAEFEEAAFADALAIYMLSLAVDFDYAELREREYPLLAPAALAERLKMMAGLFPAPDGYEFSIRYRRR